MHERRWSGGAILLAIAIVLQSFSAWGQESSEHPASQPGYSKSQHGRGGMSHGMGGRFSGAGHYLRHLLRHQEAIGLTDEQVTRLKAIQLELDKTRIRTEADIMVAERELASLVDDEKADMSAIEGKLKQSEGLSTSLRLSALKARREAMSVLNPDQRKKERLEHDKMMHQHMGGASPRGEHRGRGPDDQAEPKTRP